MKFIFEVKLNPGFSAEEYAANWVEASRIIQQTTYIGTVFTARS